MELKKYSISLHSVEYRKLISTLHIKATNRRTAEKIAADLLSLKFNCASDLLYKCINQIAEIVRI